MLGFEVFIFVCVLFVYTEYLPFRREDSSSNVKSEDQQNFEG